MNQFELDRGQLAIHADVIAADRCVAASVQHIQQAAVYHEADREVAARRRLAHQHQAVVVDVKGRDGVATRIHGKQQLACAVGCQRPLRAKWIVKRREWTDASALAARRVAAHHLERAVGHARVRHHFVRRLRIGHEENHVLFLHFLVHFFASCLNVVNTAPSGSSDL